MKNGCVTFAILLGVLGVPVALFLGVMSLAESWLGWSESAAMFAGIAFLVGLIFLFYRWMIWHQKKDQETVGELVDPVFGNVRQTRDSWEAEVFFPPLNETLLVSGTDGNIPTEIQRSTFATFQENWPDKISEIYGNLDAIEHLVMPPRPRKLKFDSLLLAADESWCSLVFDVEGSSANWGFAAEYFDGELQEISDLH